MKESVFILKFAEAKQPTYREAKGKGYVMFGDRNDYPEYLLSLFNNSAKHGAIIRNKAKYINGNGWTTDSGNPSPFVPKFNLNTLSRKVTLDIETFAGCYLEIIWSALGRNITAINHIDYLKIRTNKDNTQFWYKADGWEKMVSKEDPIVLNAFNPASGDKKQILFIKEYRPGAMAYPLPGYIGALNYIESDIEVGRHTLGNASTGFAPSKLITVVSDGEIGDEAIRDTTNQFQKRFTGSDGKKFILSFVNDASRKMIVDDLGASDMTKEDFTAIDNLISQNIYAGHEITTPSLFGVAQPGKLGTTTELKDGYEIFNNTYVNDKQRFIEGIFNLLSRYAGETEVLKIIPVNPLSVNISDALVDKYAPKEWVYERLGIDASKYSPVTVDGQQPQGQTNEALRSLTGRQHQQLLRIIRQVGQGKMTREAATVMLKGSLGLNDEDIETMLAVEEPAQMSAHDVAAIFSEYGESKDNFQIFSSRLRFSDDVDAQAFADVTQIESNVLDMIVKDKRISIEQIASILKVDKKKVSDIISSAVEKGLVKVTTSKIGTGDMQNVVIERTLTEPINKIVEKVKPTTRSFMLRYSYEWLPEIPIDERNTAAHPSRDFCVALMELNRVYSRADIETISARLGYSVFDRRGGWWNDDGVNKPHCRHRWFSQVLMKKS